MSRTRPRRGVPLREALRENKDTLLRGVTALVAGGALILAGSLVGYGTDATSQVIAGILAFSGITIAFLGFFIYLLPPLLPGK
jgi:hypothetical protein